MSNNDDNEKKLLRPLKPLKPVKPIKDISDSFTDIEEIEEEAERLEEEAERLEEVLGGFQRGDRSMNGKGPKNVTIRGIDAQIYDDFSQNMKILGMTMGDAITKMMKDILTDFDGTFPSLSAKILKTEAKLPKLTIFEHDHISISAEDLVEADARTSFHNIDFLEFEPDITKELFLRYVNHISDCKTVKLPSILPKLLVYSKIRNCDEIEIYEIDNSRE
ncbi:MAG: hypothetical protein ACFFD4_11640 [Candidatus Odinarchaeota archaeon]